MTEAITLIDAINTGGIITLLLVATYFLATGKILPKNIHDDIIKNNKEQCELHVNTQNEKIDRLAEALEKLVDVDEQRTINLVKDTVRTVLAEYDIDRK